MKRTFEEQLRYNVSCGFGGLNNVECPECEAKRIDEAYELNLAIAKLVPEIINEKYMLTGPTGLINGSTIMTITRGA